jgi:hypothetical protein
MVPHIAVRIRRGGALLAALALASPVRVAAAEGWEIAVSAGKVVPFYSQTFRYDPGSLASPIAGATIDQQGVFSLDAHGGLALNVALARSLGRHAALEARLDTADVSVKTTGARYRVAVTLPAPLPPLSTDVDLGTGSVDLDRLRPLSLNLKVRSGGRSSVAVSAGASWLPAFRFTVNETVGVGLPGLGGSRLALDVTRAALRAEALPTEEGQGRLGFNAGLSFSQAMGAHAALLLDGRYFRFQEQTLHWDAAAASGPLSAIEQTIASQIESRLEPVAFSPTFFHVSLGVAWRF